MTRKPPRDPQDVADDLADTVYAAHYLREYGMPQARIERQQRKFDALLIELNGLMNGSEE